MDQIAFEALEIPSENDGKIYGIRRYFGSFKKKSSNGRKILEFIGYGAGKLFGIKNGKKIRLSKFFLWGGGYKKQSLKSVTKKI